ncbi:MAG: NAD(P)-dependent oxidoreductase [Planctomycetales bacterium]|nr:NAD(P)-dependent oxidoreductase [Planctomycetales bacterium]
MSNLVGKTLFITGSSRGIGKAIALRAAADGANIAVVAKTSEPHPKLPGTVHTAVAEIEEAGGRALACIADIRQEEPLKAAVEQTVAAFGGIDILVNNASAIFLAGTLDTPMKRFDLMHEVNVRGTYMASHHCLPHLLNADNPHILNLSPPLNMVSKWFKPHVAYTISKFGMSMCVLGMAAELKEQGVAVNALWPQTVIATAAVQNLLGGDEVVARSRRPEIMADAAYVILTRDSKQHTGNFYVDEQVLREEGVTDFAQYAVTAGVEPLPDFFL